MGPSVANIRARLVRPAVPVTGGSAVNQNSLNSLPANFANEGLKDLNGSKIGIGNVSLPQMSATPSQNQEIRI